MRRRASLLDRQRELGSSTYRHGPTAADHPLLRLQRQAGNHAVTAMVQRDKDGDATEKESSATFFPSKVAHAPPHDMYKGKCNASFDGVRVERNWEWGLLFNDIAITFKCGPKNFYFRATESLSGGMPWSLDVAKGSGGAFVMEDITHALDTLYHHWDDEKRFGPATRVVIDALQYDVEKYCELEKEYKKRQAPTRPWWFFG